MTDQTKHLFFEKIQSVSAFSEEEADKFLSYFEFKKTKKHTILLEEGEVCHHLYFILKGALRQYFYNEEGLERTFNFGFEYDFVTDLDSFSRQAKSTNCITTMEDCECLVISCVDSMEALSKMDAVRDFFNELLEQISRKSLQHTKSLLSSSPERRWENLRHEYPQIELRIAQRYLAQYLGIAAESLSRIRKRLSETSKP